MQHLTRQWQSHQGGQLATTAKEGAEKLAKENGRQEPKKEQVRGQFGPGHVAEDHGAPVIVECFTHKKGNKPVENNYNNHNVFYSSRTDQTYPINYTIEGDGGLDPNNPIQCYEGQQQ